MKIKRRQITLGILGLVAIAAGFAAWRLHYQPKRAVAEYKRKLVAAGEKLTIAELIPPPVPLEQDGTDIFLKAVALLNKPMTLLDTNAPPAMRMVAPGKAMVGWQQPELRDDYLNAKFTNTWAETESALAEISDAMELLHEMIERPRLDFKINYQGGFNNLRLPNLSKSKSAVQRLSASALCHLHRGDTVAAVKDVRAMLALSQGTSDEMHIISQLVRMAIAGITVAVNWELLQSPGLTDEQLATLQSDWSELEFIRSVENALAMERAMLELTVSQMRGSSAEFKKMASGFNIGGAGPSSSSGNWFEDAKEFAEETLKKGKMKTKEAAWRLALSYPDQLRTLRGDQVLLETLRLAHTNGCFDPAFRWQQSQLALLGYAETDSSDSGGDWFDEPDVRTLLSRSVMSLAKVSTRVRNIEISRQLMVTVIALKRYQLRHGNYPAELAALTPEFLPAVPRDPVDGQPLRYRANPDGTFLLYSVGENTEDNGGNATSVNTNSTTFHWQHGRDWVWPQPASAAEIEAYYASFPHYSERLRVACHQHRYYFNERPRDKRRSIALAFFRRLRPPGFPV